MARAHADCTATLLVCCPDRKGLIASLAQLLYGYGINILDADQHTDEAAGKFFQRIRMDLRELHGDRHTLEGAVAEVAERFEMTWRIAYGDRPKRMAVLVSKADHCLYDLLWRHRAGELRCELPLVLGNHAELAPLARSFEIPFVHLPVDAATRATQEAALVERLEAERIELVVLARYMQVLSAELCERYAGRIINIHHSFLPAFVGNKPYHQAYSRGVKLIGGCRNGISGSTPQTPAG